MNYKKIEEETVKFLKEVITDGVYDRDQSEEYELAITMCNDLNIDLHNLEEVLAKIDAVVLPYCVKRDVTIM